MWAAWESFRGLSRLQCALVPMSERCTWARLCTDMHIHSWFARPYRRSRASFSTVPVGNQIADSALCSTDRAQGLDTCKMTVRRGLDSRNPPLGDASRAASPANSRVSSGRTASAARSQEPSHPTRGSIWPDASGLTRYLRSAPAGVRKPDDPARQLRRSHRDPPSGAGWREAID